MSKEHGSWYWQSARRPRTPFAQEHTRYHIHWTTEPDSIGKAVSSGYIRMKDQDVDLYSRVPLGTKVVFFLAISMSALKAGLR
jgi:lipoprotein-anchoring transpeptidase ErfK/SrfK